MRRFLPLLLLATLACSLFSPVRAPTPTPHPRVAQTATSAPASPTVAATTFGTATAIPSYTPAPAATPTPPAPTAGASAGPSATPEFQLTADDVRFEPDPQLYSGDIASIEVIADRAPPGWQDAKVKLYVDALSAQPLAEGDLAPFGLGNRLQATFTWVWDTRGRVGRQTVIVEVDPKPVPGGPALTQTVSVQVSLLPAEARPAPETGAHWANIQSDCCIFNYVTGTAAARDIDTIRATADAALVHAAQVLGVQQNQKIVFTLLSRLLGQGGFAAGEVSISYLDRNPATSDLFTLFAHEGTHILDRQIAKTRPTIMTEGLAVYVAGGHFKTEPLEARAAALLALDRYIPLRTLAKDFYLEQHETSYLEAGAFIQYLVDQSGWERFKAMYAAFQPAPSDAQMLDAALQVQYGQGLDALEAQWLTYLRTLPPDPAQQNDLRLTIGLYDAIRRYQQADDPSAYFLTAWLPDGPEARKRGIVADTVRHPIAPDNLALETMLVAAGESLSAGDYDRAGALLGGVNAALDANSLAASPLAAEQLAVVDQVLAAGYEPQRITLDGDSATVEAISHWPTLEQLSLRRGAGGWQILATTSMAIAVRLAR